MLTLVLIVVKALVSSQVLFESNPRVTRLVWKSQTAIRLRDIVVAATPIRLIVNYLRNVAQSFLRGF